MNNPLIPMGAITHAMTREEIRQMMERYHEAGIEQYLFYARGGCTVEFMSDEWLDICEAIVEEAERLSMTVWLYDEYDCPSGTCAKSILRDRPDLGAWGVDLSGSVVKQPGYLPMADVLSAAAADEFITRTYEKLYARLKRFFGTTVRGVFSDEPSMPCTLKPNVDTHPYTPGLEDDLRRECGLDLFEGIRSGDGAFMAAYYEFLGKRFREAFLLRLKNWCERHGVLFTGHLLEEQRMRTAVLSNGNTLKALQCFSLPGMDEIRGAVSDDAEPEWITLGSIQYARNENGALCEVGAFGPCDQPLGRYLQQIYLLSLFGVTHYVLAVSAADACGSTVKTDWLHPTNYMQPHFAFYDAFGSLARSAAEIARKRIAVDVAVEYPARAAAEIIAEKENPVDEKLLALLKALNLRQYQWVFVNEDDPTPEGALRVKYDEDISALSALLPRHPLITEADGSLPQNILVRRYTDGSVYVLNRSDDDIKREMRYNGKAFTLLPRALRDLRKEEPEITVAAEKRGTVRMTLREPNLKRCVFGAEETEYAFFAAEPVGVRVIRRVFRTEGDIYLDGQRLETVEPCACLTPGIRELYAQSGEILLEAGRHTVKIDSHPGKSEYFLPSAWISGRFEESREGLIPLRETCEIGEELSARLPDFAGKIAYETETDVPAGGQDVFLTVDARELCVEAFMDGVSLGRRICHPYAFKVPDRFAGKRVRLRLEQYTTVGPVFGRRDEVVRGISEQRVLFRYFPGKYERSGIGALGFVYMKPHKMR